MLELFNPYPFSESTIFLLQACMHYLEIKANQANRTGLLSDILFKCSRLITAASLPRNTERTPALYNPLNYWYIIKRCSSSTALFVHRYNAILKIGRKLVHVKYYINKIPFLSIFEYMYLIISLHNLWNTVLEGKK